MKVSYLYTQFDPHALNFLQSVPNLVVGVQPFCRDHYTSYEVGNVHDKFQGCTVDVQVATVF